MVLLILTVWNKIEIMAKRFDVVVVSSDAINAIKTDLSFYQLYNLLDAREFIKRANNADSQFKPPSVVLIDCCLKDDSTTYFTKPKGAELAKEFKNC